MQVDSRRAWRLGVPVAAWIIALALGAHALRHPSPLTIDFGSGDEAVASGFSEGWAHYEVRGKTTFRWTGPAASIELPLIAKGRDVTIEMRLARLSERATEVGLATCGRELQTWRQHPIGWRVRRFPAGEWNGPVALTVRSPPSEDQPAGIAIDWCALHGVESIWPRREVWSALLALLVGAPLVAGLLWRRHWPLAYGSPALLAILAIWATHDSVAAVTAAVLAGPRVLIACALALPLALWVGRRADDAPSRAFLCVPTLLAVVALLALSNPRYHYPDVDTHARFLAGMRAQPGWSLDPREYQQRTRAWTRLIDERYVGFPYSAAFHVLAWPLAPVLGEVGAVKTTAVMALALGIVLVYRLARAAGLSPPAAVLAQGLFALMPVVPSRLTLALLPSLLGQAMELWLLLALATRLRDPHRWRTFLAAALLLFAVQVSYTGSLYNVAALVLLWTAVELARGSRRAALALLAAYCLAAAAVALLQYRYFIPTLLSDVLPHFATSGATSASAAEAATVSGVLTRPAQRLWIFFGPFGLVLSVAGWIALARVTRPIRQALFVALSAGLALLLLRPAWPALFSDAKEVELLAGPMAVAIALGATWLWSQRRAGQVLAALLLTALATWSLLRALELYASRLTPPFVG